MDLNFVTTRIFLENYNAKTRFVVNQGGTRSGKTYSLAQLFIIKMLKECNKTFVVARKTLPALRITVMKDFFEILNKMNLIDLFEYQKTTHTLTCKATNSTLIFINLDDPQKKRGFKANYAWFNESNEMFFDDFFQINMRLNCETTDGNPNQFFFDFNPSDPYFWIYDKIVSQPDCTFIKSTYLDNPFLDEYSIKEIEKLKETAPDLWTIYGLGETALISNLIYPKYKIVPEMPNSTNKIYGLDFGYNHPTCLTEIIEYDGAYYVNELIYKSGLTNNDLIELMKSIDVDKNLPIYADCAEPNRIEEIRRAGFNINQADKSVKDGILFVKAHNLFLTSKSINLLKEIKSYKWIEKSDGVITDIPIKFNDDGMDSMRYGIYTHSKKYVSFNNIMWL